MGRASWPHPTSPLGARTDEADCLDLLLDHGPDAGQRRMMPTDIPAVVYGF